MLTLRHAKEFLLQPFLYPLHRKPEHQGDQDRGKDGAKAFLAFDFRLVLFERVTEVGQLFVDTIPVPRSYLSSRGSLLLIKKTLSSHIFSLQC
jgi:hypothetical protein